MMAAEIDIQHSISKLLTNAARMGSKLSLRMQKYNRASSEHDGR
jgi:hypothetical protein